MNNLNLKYIDAATNIGLQLSRDAIWNNDQCNWITKTFDADAERMIPIFKTLPPEFYSGTVGVSYFLATLYSITQEPIFYKTAIGALNQAIAQKGKIEPEHIISFHRGMVGILYTLTYINQIHLEEFGCKKYDETEIIDIIHNNNIEDSMPDIIDGCSGGLIPLIKIYKTYPSDKLKTSILKLGNQLIATATKEEEGWSWKSRGVKGKNLLGYSHGTAGIAHAFLELYQFSKDKKYSTAAYEAIKYENKFYDATSKNWPDFRQAQPENHSHQGQNHVCAWCNGASGIGLGRIRGYEITNDPSLKTDAETAIETTSKQLELTSQHEGDFSLCHGLAGNSDLLIEAAHSLEKPQLMNLVHQIATIGIQKYSDPNLPWVNGIGDTFQIPDFMVGISGIGYFYLRLVDPKRFPSILAINARNSFLLKLEKNKNDLIETTADY